MFLILELERRPLEMFEMEITFEEFKKLDLRIGRIIDANQIPGSRNLVRILVNFGTEKRQAVAGLLQWYKPQDLLNKECVFILNLQKRRVMGVESQCMILAAEDDKGKAVILQPEAEIAEGSQVR